MPANALDSRIFWEQISCQVSARAKSETSVKEEAKVRWLRIMS
jgi:hypothetical protein